MISSLRGKVLSVTDDSIILDVSGFGIQVYVSKALITNAVAGEELSCSAYMQISDAGVSMFGFADETEKELFLELVQVKTVGGKLAITVLRHNNLNDIIQAITSASPQLLSAPGLGAKRAERICFELKNKIAKKFPQAGGTSVSFSAGSFDSSVVDALVGLGFSQSEAARAVALSKGTADPDKEWTESDLLRSSLGLLQRR